MLRRASLVLCLAASVAATAEPAGPRDVARDFLEAVFVGAPDRALALCTGDGLTAEVEGLAAYLAAFRRVEAALVRRFGPAGEEALHVEAELRRLRAELVKAPVLLGERDSATVALPGGTGLSADALVLRRAEGRWRIVAGPRPAPEMEEHFRAFGRSFAAAADAVAKELDAGRYATPKEAVADTHARQRALASSGARARQARPAPGKGSTPKEKTPR